LFIKKACNDIIPVQVYVDDIIFGSTNEVLCEQFVKAMQGEFEMSMMENSITSLAYKLNNFIMEHFFANQNIVENY